MHSAKIGNLLLLCFFQLLLLSGTSFAAFDTDPFLDQRVTLDAPPIDAISEHIDPYSGNMQIVQTDLHLPGNGGLDLTIMRTYNSLIWNRRGIVNPVNLALRDHSPLGIGWTMHMGLLRNPDKIGTEWGGTPIMELPDGTKQIFVQDISDPTRKRLISKDFWILKVITAFAEYEVKSPQGFVYTFKYHATPIPGASAGYVMSDTNVMVAQTTKIQNPAGTASINITYSMVGGSFSYIQTITDSLNRVIKFNYEPISPQNANLKLKSITVPGINDSTTRTISYTYTTQTLVEFLLSTVTPPVGNTWKYGYDTTYELNSLTYPSGGINTYTYSDINFWTGPNCGPGYGYTNPWLYRVVTQKTASGRSIPTGGTWTYTYNSGGTPNKTVINGPNVTETHQFWGWGNSVPTKITGGDVWRVGLPISKEFSFNGTPYKEDYTWSKGTQISLTPVSNVSFGCSGELITDGATYVPFASSKTITRDGKTYTTTNSDFTTYGDPKTVVETGDVSRTRTLDYCTNATKNIVKGKPLSESVTGRFSVMDPNTTTTTTWQYGASNDCVDPTVITKDGVGKTIGYDAASGNVSSITDARGNKTSYFWDKGRISQVTYPTSTSLSKSYSITRVINTDGTIASEKDGRLKTTSYLYDLNLRPTRVTPPIGNYTTISYATDNATKTVARGGYSITYSYDGFGRLTGSSDSKGITTTTAYFPYGVKDYTSSSIGDKTNYDFFGRPTQVLDQDNYKETYGYALVNGTTSVTVTDKNSKTSVMTYNAFNNPDEKYLMAVKDQNSVSTSYARNIRGNVTGITQGAISHTYGYNAKYFLTAETHPETSAISYGRDNVGNMISRTDGTGTKNYGYDDINRPTSITVGGNNITLDYDNANNRTLLTSPSASITYTYDDANNLKTKNETIAGRAYVTGYNYDNNDNITGITYPSGRIATYGFNGNNQAISINSTVNQITSPIVSTVLYYSTGSNHAGLPSSLTYANGIVNNISYNNRNLITDLTAGSALNIRYGYDTRGNTTSLTDNLTPSKNQALGYDDLSRLKTANGAWGTGGYEYDDYGNRKSKTVGGSSTYTYSSNRLSSVTGSEAASYSYNNNGALMGGSWGGNNYTLGYDVFDNLSGYSITGSTPPLASFGYDGDGQRVTKTANGKTVVYHYDQAGNAITETDNNGAFIADYILLNGKLVAKVAAVPDISASPTTKAFGDVVIGFTPPSTVFTILNRGTADLSIGIATITGTSASDFTKSADSCTGQKIAPSATCTITVSSVPSTTGTKVASLTIPSNDPDTPSLSVALTATGVLPRSLSVTVSGSGSGTVNSVPSGISCGSTCNAQYVPGTSVSLTAVTAPCSSFTGWSGACSGTGACVVTLSADTTVTANFSMLPPVANFTLTPTTGSAPVLVNFSDLSQCASTWSWDFGNGSTSNQQNPSQTYNTTGNYSVSLTVTNLVGTDTTAKTSVLSIPTCSAPVRILGAQTFQTLQDAFNLAPNGAVIQSTNQNFVENVTNTNPNSFTLSGGYTCDYSSITGKTNLKGTLSINNGTLSIEDVDISD